MEEIEVCALCGSLDNNNKTDHLRECFKMNQEGKFDSAMYQPRLSYDEIGKLQMGFNTICNNRAKCHKRQEYLNLKK